MITTTQLENNRAKKKIYEECDSLHWLPYQCEHGMLPISMLEQQTRSKIKRLKKQ